MAARQHPAIPTAVARIAVASLAGCGQDVPDPGEDDAGDGAVVADTATAMVTATAGQE